MRQLYVTDEPKTHELLIKEGKTCFLSKLSLSLSLDSVGTVIKPFYVDEKKYDVCLSAFNKEIISEIDNQLSLNDENILINTFSSTEKGQFIFDMLLFHLTNKEKITKVNRIWANDTNQLTNEIRANIEDFNENSEYKALSQYYMAREILDTYWTTSKITSHSNLQLTMHQYYILNLINEAEEKIKESKQSTFFKICASLGNLTGEVSSKGFSKFFGIEEANTVYNQMNKSFVIIKSNYKERHTQKAALFSMQELIKYASGIPNIGEVLKNLYNKGFITNPNTKNHYLSADQFDLVIQYKDSLPKRYSHLISHVEKYGLQEDILRRHFVTNYVNELVVTTDHTHAILPIPCEKFNELSENEIAIYDLLVTRFLSIFLPPPIKYTKKIEAINSNNLKLNVSRESYLSYGSDIFELRNDTVFEELDIDTSSFKYTYPVGSGILPKDIMFSITGNVSKTPQPMTKMQLNNMLMNMGKRIIPKHLKSKYRHFLIGDPLKWQHYVDKLLMNNLILKDDKNRYILTDLGKSFIGNSKSFLINLKNLNSLYVDQVKILVNSKNMFEVIENHVRTIETLYNCKSYSESKPANYKYIVNNYSCVCGAKLKDHENFIGCTNYPNCKFTLSKDIRSGNEYRFTEKDIVELLTIGETSTVIQNFKFKSGKSSNIKFKLDESNKVTYSFAK